MKNKLLVLIMLCITGICCGCGMSEEDASEYVKASLDAAYKGEFGAFVDITESTPEGAQAMYEENIIHTMEAAGFSDMEISDELTDKYRQLFHEISNAVNYTVGDAVESEDGGYDVLVDIYPLTLFTEVTEDDITEAVIERISEMKKYPSDKKIVEITFEELYELYSEKIKNPEYSDEKISQTVSIHKNDKGMYYISEEDMMALDKGMFELNNK